MSSLSCRKPLMRGAKIRMTRLPEFVGVHCESIEFLPDIQYTTVSDYLSHLGTYPSKAEGTIQDVSVTWHQDERHLNEHTDKQQTQGSSLHKDRPKLFESRRLMFLVPMLRVETGSFPRDAERLCSCVPGLTVGKRIEVHKRNRGQTGAYTATIELILLK